MCVSGFALCLIFVPRLLQCKFFYAISNLAASEPIISFSCLMMVNIRYKICVYGCGEPINQNTTQTVNIFYTFCYTCGQLLFDIINIFVRIFCNSLFFDFLFALFRIIWWTPAGRKLSVCCSVYVVLYLIPSLASVFLSRVGFGKGCKINL